MSFHIYENLRAGPHKAVIHHATPPHRAGIFVRSMLCYLRESGAVSALDYAILAGIVIVALAAALSTFDDSLVDLITTIGPRVEAVATTAGGGG